MAEILTDVIIAFFAAIGVLFVLWHIVEIIGRARGKVLAGTYIYIPAVGEDEEFAKQAIESTLGDMTMFKGKIIVICSGHDEKSEVIEEFCRRFGRIYKYEAGSIEIRNSDGTCDNRGND